MKRNLLFAFALLIMLSGKAQLNFSISNINADDLILETNGNKVFAGHFGGSAAILKTDSSGNSIWSKQINNVTEIKRGVYLNGYYYFAGTKSNGLILLKTDTNGNLVWSKESVEIQNYSFPNLLIADSILFLSANNNKYINLQAFDLNGNLLWSKSIGCYYPDFNNNSELITVGEYLYCIYTWQNRLMISKYDFEGNQNWLKLYYHLELGAAYINPVLTFQNNLIISGFDWNNNATFIFSIDTSGQVIMKKKFVHEYSNYLLPDKLIHTYNHFYLLSGVEDWSQSVSGYRYCIAEFDSSFNFLQQVEFNESFEGNLFAYADMEFDGQLFHFYKSFGYNTDSIETFTIHSIHQLVCDTLHTNLIPVSFVGPMTIQTYLEDSVGITFQNFTPSISNYSVLKQQNCIAMQTADVKTHEEKLNIYPNPNKGTFEIVVAEILNELLLEIYNSTGQLIHQKNFNSNKIIVNLKENAAGIYFAILKSEKEIISRNKIIIE